MDYNEIIKNYTEEKKDLIVELATKNKSQIRNYSKYDNHSLDYFFDLWHTHFPNNSQSKNCEGCRKAVTKFFHSVADFITEQKEIKKSKKIEKTTKASKKSKTRVGALAQTGTRK
jgi:hypothetical protein